MKYAELAQQQAQLLIDLMAQGKPFLPFLKPGDPRTVNNLPYNPTTGKAYRGGNRIMLWIVAISCTRRHRRRKMYAISLGLNASGLNRCWTNQKWKLILDRLKSLRWNRRRFHP